jgi:aryl-alcohol dehydrogenase-like predicted oxidoreductase
VPDARIAVRQRRVSAFAVLQPKYNVMDRDQYEDALQLLCTTEGIACVPHSSLAKGFLTGKYRGRRPVESSRAEGASAYFGTRGDVVLGGLDALARAHGTSVAAVALGWLAAQPTVVSVIASARTPAQLDELLPMATLKLVPEEVEALAYASTRKPGGGAR